MDPGGVHPPTDEWEMWFDSDVSGTDGVLGSLSALVCSEPGNQLRELVLRGSEHRHHEHPVPCTALADANRSGVTLELTTAAVHERRFHTETVVLAEDPLRWMELDGGGMGWRPWDQPFEVPVTVPHLGDEETMVRHRALVIAGTHHIGHLAGVTVDRNSFKLRGLIVDMGHLWHRHVAVLPATTIERMSEFWVWVKAAETRS